VARPRDRHPGARRSGGGRPIGDGATHDGGGHADLLDVVDGGRDGVFGQHGQIGRVPDRQPAEAPLQARGIRTAGRVGRQRVGDTERGHRPDRAGDVAALHRGLDAAHRRHRFDGRIRPERDAHAGGAQS
jgi:hypothetical protein